MTADVGRARPRRLVTRATAPPEWLAYLRLRGIAEQAGRVAVLLAQHYNSPACAAGLFRMTGGWYVASGFNGERHWRYMALSAFGAIDEYSLILDEIAKATCPPT
jgi:hypothetical protein